MRHPYGLGGAAYSVSMIWAQIMPFVALSFYEGGNKEQLQTLLLGSFGLWLVLNGLFFCSIERSFLGTFFSSITAPQFTVELFRNSDVDFAKFDAAFTNRRSYINGCEDEIKTWVAQNIDRWRVENEAWFDVRLIGDEFLPIEVFEVEGGAKRRRSSTAVSEKYLALMNRLGAREFNIL